VVGIIQVFQVALSLVAEARRDFGEPDRGFDGLDLAKEGADVVES